MRVGSLFSGIGGLDLGLERAGMEIVWQVEIDEWCQRVLERHWPDVARFRDVRDCHGSGACPSLAYTQRFAKQEQGHETNTLVRERGTRLESEGGDSCRGCLPFVDLICGGFPCQPVSHAGRRQGDTDKRWLWPEMYRIIREVQPRWVLIENVPGLRSIDAGRLFRGILWDLSQAGFDAEWCALSAADVGAPHLRERVFVVADAPRIHVQGYDDGQRQEQFGGSDWWAVEPNVGRVAHGTPLRVDRLRGLGNAVVPQVAEVIGRWIMEATT